MSSSSMYQARLAAVLDQVARPARAANYPTKPDSKTPVYISELFAENFFTLKQRQTLNANASAETVNICVIWLYSPFFTGHFP